METKLTYKSTICHYRNEKLTDYYKSFGLEHDRKIAMDTVIFIKENFPECNEFLRGKLIETKISIGGI